MAAKKKDAEPDDKDTDDKPEGEGGEGGEGADLPKKKVSGKKLVLIIVAAVVLLTAGVGAALYFTGILGGQEDHAADEAHAAEAADHGVAGAPVYFEMTPMTINLTSTGRRPVFMRMKAALVLNSEEEKTAVTQNMPRIVDGFQTYLRELTIDEIQGSAGLLRLREELLVRVNAAVAPVKVKDILFQEILPQGQ